MFSIGEFSKICKVSTKTLRYYAEIGLLQPKATNPETGYRYYDIDQLQTMLLIDRLKGYQCSLEEIKELFSKQTDPAFLLSLLQQKKLLLLRQNAWIHQQIESIDEQITRLQNGDSFFAHPLNFEVEECVLPPFRLLSTRTFVKEEACPYAYSHHFSQLLQKIEKKQLTMVASPMVLFHSSEYGEAGLDSEFAIPIQEDMKEASLFHPGACLKTTLHGAYHNLPFVYAKQQEVLKAKGYKMNGPLFECYLNDPSQVKEDKELCTEVYCPFERSTPYEQSTDECLHPAI